MDDRRMFAFYLSLASCFSLVTGGIYCLQCNVFVQGTTNTCDNPRNVSHCLACLKTLTKIKLHDRWGEKRISSVISRFCIRDVSSALHRDEGCYTHRNNGGYTERCYCYTSNCNSGMTLTPRWTLLSIVMTGIHLIGLLRH